MKVDKNDSILFKPVIFEKSIVFDLVGKQIESHPVIVFYDDTKNEYWYLGARSSYFFDKNTEKWEKKETFWRGIWNQSVRVKRFIYKRYICRYN